MCHDCKEGVYAPVVERYNVRKRFLVHVDVNAYMLMS